MRTAARHPNIKEHIMAKPIVNKASTQWNGDLMSGSGKTTFDSSSIGTFDVNWKARAEESGAATTPEELIAAAHATCYSMAFSHALAGNNTPPEQVNTSAEVTFVAGEGITGIHLTMNATIPDLNEDDFQRIANEAKDGCPVSQALKAVPISLTATLNA